MNRKSIEYVLSKMGVDSIKQSGEWLMISCPLAPWTHAGGTDRRPSFGVRESKGVSGVHCFSCFDAGTQVRVKDGLKSIEDIKIGDFVLSENNKWEQVINVMKRPYNERLVEIDIAGTIAPIRCTEDHRFYAIQVPDRKCGSNNGNRRCYPGYACCSFGRDFDFSVKEVPAKDLRYGDLVLAPVPSEGSSNIVVEKMKYVSGPRPKELDKVISIDKDMARFIGLYIAEGSFSHRNVVFSFHKNEHELIDFVQYMIGKLGFKSNVYLSPTSQGAQVYCSSVALGVWLQELCGHRAENKHIPDSVLGLSDTDVLEGLFNGLVEGDGGNLSSQGRADIVTYSTISKTLALQFLELSFKLGYTGNIVIEKANRKRGVYHKENYRIRCRKTGVQQNVRVIEGNRFVKVRSVRVGDKPLDGFVYNLTVNNSHKYVVQNALVANCGFKGGMLSLVREYGKHAVEEGLWSTELMQELIDFVILAEDEDEVEEHIVPPEEVRVPVKLESYLNTGHEYFDKRGITEETIKEWNLGFVESYKDKDAGIYMYNRVLFPIYAKDGLHEQLVGIIGRSTDGEEPKYKNAPPNFRKANYVYGGWLAKDRRKIIVVEGPIDCLIVNQNLKKHKIEDLFAVALLGADPSERQIDWLKDNADEVICMLDNDPSGKLGTKKLIEALDPHVVVSVVEWDDRHKDPDEAGAYVITMLNCRETVLEHRLSRLLRL